MRTWYVYPNEFYRRGTMVIDIAISLGTIIIIIIIIGGEAWIN